MALAVVVSHIFSANECYIPSRKNYGTGPWSRSSSIPVAQTELLTATC
jgi:hypothetical protein